MGSFICADNNNIIRHITLLFLFLESWSRPLSLSLLNYDIAWKEQRWLRSFNAVYDHNQCWITFEIHTRVNRQKRVCNLHACTARRTLQAPCLSVDKPPSILQHYKHCGYIYISWGHVSKVGLWPTQYNGILKSLVPTLTLASYNVIGNAYINCLKRTPSRKISHDTTLNSWI